MSNERYDAGDVVPVDICPMPGGGDDNRVQFAVPVEVFDGYGSAKHVYPIEQVDSLTALFSHDEVLTELLVSDDVRLYTVPHDMLW